MIPYIHIADVKAGPVTLHPFGILVALGVVTGMALAKWRARALGVDIQKLSSFIGWVLVCGFVGGHVLDEIFYHPGEIARMVDGHFELTRPWSLLFLWEGLSSFGGFTGALTGAFLWKFFELRPAGVVGPIKFTWLRRRVQSESILPLCDVLLSVFPVAWIFAAPVAVSCTTIRGRLRRQTLSSLSHIPGAPRSFMAWSNSFTAAWLDMIWGCSS